MIKQIFYYWKSKKDKNWLPFSIAHNKKEREIVEKAIKKHIKNSQERLMFKKLKGGIKNEQNKI
tara:strand:+ start:44 stop:235 length:192 start_codon:yes stop_codon:yes gene_type:complete